FRRVLFRSPGVPAAGDVRGGDHLEHRRVLAHRPVAIALGEVSVEVDDRDDVSERWGGGGHRAGSFVRQRVLTHCRPPPRGRHPAPPQQAQTPWPVNAPRNAAAGCSAGRRSVPLRRERSVVPCSGGRPRSRRIGETSSAKSRTVSKEWYWRRLIPSIPSTSSQ